MTSFAEDHAYYNGREAFCLGKRFDDNPHACHKLHVPKPGEEKLCKSWDSGWQDARDEAYEKAKKEAKA